MIAVHVSGDLLVSVPPPRRRLISFPQIFFIFQLVSCSNHDVGLLFFCLVVHFFGVRSSAREESRCSSSVVLSKTRVFCRGFGRSLVSTGRTMSGVLNVVLLVLFCVLAVVISWPLLAQQHGSFFWRSVVWFSDFWIRLSPAG